MSFPLVLDLARGAVTLALMLAGPLLLAALIMGLLIAVLQAVTQVQEQTLAFVVKLIAVGTVFVIMLNWLLQTGVKYMVETLTALPSLVS
jgi:flagellar biosynthesis protein FliQ